MQETIYHQAAAAYIKLGANDGPLPKVTLAHYPIDDTALAACLLCLGIPPREPGPYTDCVQLTESGNEKCHKLQWWVGSHSPDGTQVTEWLIGAWIMRHAFETEHALHPLVSMRAGIDARNWWNSQIAPFRQGRALFPTEVPATPKSFVTGSISEAGILKACGYRPLAFTGHAFSLEAERGGVHAQQVIDEAEKPGAAPPQCMSAAIRQYSHMLGIAKSQSIIIALPVDGQTLLLTQDVTKKTRALFHRHL